MLQSIGGAPATSSGISGTNILGPSRQFVRPKRCQQSSQTRQDVCNEMVANAATAYANAGLCVVAGNSAVHGGLLAAPTGTANHGLEAIEIRDLEFLEAFEMLIDDEFPGLLKQLARLEGPASLVQFVYRSTAWGPNAILAFRPPTMNKLAAGQVQAEVVIRKLGDVGCILVPPTPGITLSSAGAELTKLPTIDVVHRAALIKSAQFLSD